MNIMCSDYCDADMKYSQKRPAFYTEFAKALIIQKTCNLYGLQVFLAGAQGLELPLSSHSFNHCFIFSIIFICFRNFLDAF